MKGHPLAFYRISLFWIRLQAQACQKDYIIAIFFATAFFSVITFGTLDLNLISIDPSGSVRSATYVYPSFPSSRPLFSDVCLSLPISNGFLGLSRAQTTPLAQANKSQLWLTYRKTATKTSHSSTILGSNDQMVDVFKGIIAVG